MRLQKIFPFLLRLAAAVILLQTLWFKFSAHPESVALFSKLGVEPWGRVATGIAELIAAILLLYRPSVVWGALLTLGIMSGAILSHLFAIGIESAGDGGQLFIMAWVVWAIAVVLCLLYRQDAVAVKILRALGFTKKHNP